MKVNILAGLLTLSICVFYGCEKNNESNNPTPANSVESKTDIIYAKLGNENLLMDFFAPKFVIDGKPVVIWFAGGGGTNKSRASQEAILLTEAGYAVFAPNYALISGQSPYPGYIHNIKGAIRFVKSHAIEYGINPNNIFVGGTSFGGVVSALAALTSNRTDLEGNVGGNLHVSSSVGGALDFFGSVYFGRVPGSQTPPGKMDEAYSIIFGCADVNNCPEADSLMVERFIQPKAPPFLIVHGLEDKLSSPVQSQIFHQKLISAGITSNLILVPQMGHTDELVANKFDDVKVFLLNNTVK